jgi:spore coat polysaccharide biosynthesis protein SpsF
VIVATTDSASDDELAAYCQEIGVECFRGSEFDVLDRFIGAIVHLDDGDVLVRVTGDCPFVDPEIIDRCIAQLMENDLDFVANRLPPPTPRTYPLGLDVEVCTVRALRQAALKTQVASDREHVMPYLYSDRGKFRVFVMQLEEDLSRFRWTVDTSHDFEAVERLHELVGPEPYSWEDVLAVAQLHPEIGLINSGVAQKSLEVVDDRWSNE